MKIQQEKGFTLIELLISIAIVAILAAILVPQYSAYKKKAVAGTFEGAIVSCGSELAAENALNTSIVNRSCQIPGGGSCTLDINSSGIINGCTSATISGVSVICSWSNNQFSCNPQ